MAAGKREEKDDSLGYRLALGGIKGVVRILVIIALIMILVYLGKQALDSGDGRAVTVTITDDMSVRQIGKLLISNGLLNESANAFVVQELISGYHGEILPGTYTLRTSMTADDMFPVLAQEEDSDTPDNVSADSVESTSAQ